MSLNAVSFLVLLTRQLLTFRTLSTSLCGQQFIAFVNAHAVVLRVVEKEVKADDVFLILALAPNGVTQAECDDPL